MVLRDAGAVSAKTPKAHAFRLRAVMAFVSHSIPICASVAWLTRHTRATFPHLIRLLIRVPLMEPDRAGKFVVRKSE